MLDTHARWQGTADIIVAGYGGAGAVAAIAAHDLGAEVLVLGKQPRDGHCTTTSMSAGAFLCPTDVEAVSRHLEDLHQADEGLAWTDGDSLRAWTAYSHENKAWVEAMGAKLKLPVVGGVALASSFLPENRST